MSVKVTHFIVSAALQNKYLQEGQVSAAAITVDTVLRTAPDSFYAAALQVDTVYRVPDAKMYLAALVVDVVFRPPPPIVHNTVGNSGTRRTTTICM